MRPARQTCTNTAGIETHIGGTTLRCDPNNWSPKPLAMGATAEEWKNTDFVVDHDDVNVWHLASLIEMSVVPHLRPDGMHLHMWLAMGESILIQIAVPIVISLEVASVVTMLYRCSR